MQRERRDPRKMAAGQSVKRGAVVEKFHVLGTSTNGELYEFPRVQ